MFRPASCTPGYWTLGIRRIRRRQTRLVLVLIRCRWQLCDVRLIGVEVRANGTIEIDGGETGGIAMEVSYPALLSHWIAVAELVA